MKKEETIDWQKDFKEITSHTGKKIRTSETKTTRISIYSNKTVYHIEIRNIKDPGDFIFLSIQKAKVKSLDGLIDFLKNSLGS